MVEEAESTSPKKSSIPGDQLAEWLSDHQVLSVALEGNIDHVQYTDRIKGIALSCFTVGVYFLFQRNLFHWKYNLKNKSILTIQGFQTTMLF